MAARRSLSAYEPAMDPAKAWAVMNAARACDPRASIHDAACWFGGAVRGGIVFG